MRTAINHPPVLGSLNVEGTSGKATVRWAAGTDDEFVHTYFITVRRGGEVVCTKKVLSDFYHVPRTSLMKPTWSLDIPLDPGEYEISLCARDSWDAESNTLRATVTVHQASPDKH